MRKGDKSTAVQDLQLLLLELGYRVGADGDFGDKTDLAVRRFQKRAKIAIDGIVGPGTLRALQDDVDMNACPDIIQNHLRDDEYYKAVTPKNTIYLHHTAGGSHAGNVIGAWESDKTKSGAALKVATAFVIGGPTAKIHSMDGKIYEAFNSDYWAHHLGTKFANNTLLNTQSVGIEVCNWGPLTKSRAGKFLTYVNTEVPAKDVCVLDAPFRGYKYYHKYSEAQIETLRRLILYIMARHNISLQKNFVWTAASFELNKRAAAGEAGMWAHTHVRKDKTDMYPQPELLEMLNKLHEDYA